MNAQRTLLLTDVVDSTQLAERLGDAAAAELSVAHDRVARDLLRQWRGREIDKTDGMLMLFEHPADAVGFALAYHAALAGLPVPLKARAGLHVGAVILRANPPEDVAHGAKPLEVEGIAKPIAARVMSLAMGGQTLLTSEARAALGDTTLRVQSHGHWRIKGIVEPVELFEVGDERAPFVPPPDSAKVYRVIQRDELWLPVRDVAHSLPAERDAFVGRQDALAELARRFDAGARLVSVLGIGGTGKTRLATRFAWTWQGDYPGGAWFCDLSSARTVQGIAQAVAQSLSVPLGAEDPVQQLGHAIAARGSCLLVLDNFEQVARHAEETLGRWLDRAADARFLVTTREVLGLPGEEAMALAPLEAAEAIALFERRARAVNGSAVDADEAAAIAQLVKLLDGLPLAIELAAARVRVMPPRALVARMDQRFRLLTAGGGRRDRQATLRATFDWSWELLSDAERSALAQLSVFEGGFTLEAAEGVLDLRRFSAGAWAVDLLQSLVDKSFVRSLGGGRFDLLSSVQDYAAGHLGSAGRFSGSGSAARNGAHARHAGYFARLAEHGSEALHLQEFDNLAAACRRAALLGDAETAVAALEGAWSVLEHRGPFDAGIELAQAVCQLPPLDAASRARAALIAGLSLNAAGRVAEAQLRLRQALEFALAGRRADVQARVLVALGDIHVNLAMFEAGRDLHEQARAMAAAEGLHSVECMALNGLGSACVDLGHIDQARDCYEAALRAARVAGDRRWQGWVLGNLGTLHFSEGALERAAEGFSAALEIARELGDRKGEGNMLCNLAAVHEMRGRLSEALQSSQEALQVARAIGHVRLECTVQCNLGLATMEMRQWTQAQAHLDAALTLSRHLQDRRSEGLFLAYMGQLLARQGRFDEGRACLDAGEPLLEQVADGNGLGLLLCRRAELEALAGHAVGAEAALDRARSISTRLSSADDSELGASLRMAVRALAGLQPSAGS